MPEHSEQVRRNFDAFMRQLPELLTTHRGKFALMHDAIIIEFFDTAGDSYRAGQKLYQDQNFSIQEVTDKSVDLGFFTHALSERPI